MFAKKSRRELFNLVQGINLAADSIQSAGSEIAAANTDLARRTSEQSAVVSATASEAVEVTRKVVANLRSATNANQISRETFKAAESGQKIMEGVVTTINAMKSSSTKIGAIIGVINEIAFQTNLLALNAAVEAARAGEQGRGFAVVAGEVRGLAQRCATAANEIAQLIRTSATDVELGVSQVASAGSSMDGILKSVHTLSDVIGEMVDAGQAQSSGIERIRSAINKIDNDAQQNAAMVEQTSAAAEQLKDQVSTLMESINGFELGSTYSDDHTLQNRSVSPALQQNAPLHRRVA